MTGFQRSVLVITLTACSAMFAFCATVDRWTAKSAFAALAILTSTVASGVTKAPRDASISDKDVQAQSASAPTEGDRG